VQLILRVHKFKKTIRKKEGGPGMGSAPKNKKRPSMNVNNPQRGGDKKDTIKKEKGKRYAQEIPRRRPRRSG